MGITHFDVNWLAVILATVASMALGAAWYMILSRQWMAAAGITEDDIKSGSSVTPFVWATACQLVMAYFLALLTPVIMGDTTVYNAVLIGIHMWVGFIVTSMILNHRYQGKPWSLSVIDGGYLLGVVIVQGIVLGLLG
ncbi:DUF1761 domain-containing protein [Pelagibacterium xiamenense]|uniref:DUF1761 domain-containing protein n=1 Tax=Pelagibacterium xiamenense TaxID=2901140 RepID=UPI001E4E2D50|nr:DUF1761 domain-containing protein [Pelagibacterium xiamenense]MCD7058308.1 DUF1761 domain-containing protein [Pelagibacterium xiamenense]